MPLILLLLLLLTPVCLAEKLSPQDYQHLHKQQTYEHILYERYLESSKGPVSVMGYHFDTFISAQSFMTLAIFGAIAGDRGGYGIAAIGLGQRWQILNNVNLTYKILMGSGGGGGVPAGGGLAFEPQTIISWELTRNTFLDMGIGKLFFPSGSFASPIYHLGLSFKAYQVKLAD